MTESAAPAPFATPEEAAEARLRLLATDRARLAIVQETLAGEATTAFIGAITDLSAGSVPFGQSAEILGRIQSDISLLASQLNMEIAALDRQLNPVPFTPMPTPQNFTQ